MRDLKAISIKGRRYVRLRVTISERMYLRLRKLDEDIGVGIAGHIRAALPRYCKALELAEKELAKRIRKRMLKADSDSDTSS